MTVVCYRLDGWPVAVAIADVSVLKETFNGDGSLWNYRPYLSISKCLFINKILWCPNVDFQGGISVPCASHSCAFIQCALLAMFRVMCGEFGDWLSIRVEWFEYCGAHAFIAFMHAFTCTMWASSIKDMLCV